MAGEAFFGRVSLQSAARESLIMTAFCMSGWSVMRSHAMWSAAISAVVEQALNCRWRELCVPFTGMMEAAVAEPRSARTDPSVNTRVYPVK